MLSTLDMRVRQLHASLYETRSSDLGCIEPVLNFSPDSYYCSVDFSNGIDDVKALNSIEQLIANIACLKDHLKEWCRAQNRTFNGDQLIDTDQAVAIVHDLWNRCKHGALDRSRSHKYPRLGRVHRAMQLRPPVILSVDPETGKMRQTGRGRAQLVLDAEVLDNAGLIICSLSQVAERALAAWLDELREAGVRVL